MRRLVKQRQLRAYAPIGTKALWQSMDTRRDKAVLEEAWQNGAPWKT
jgi:hypothetical protein